MKAEMGTSHPHLSEPNEPEVEQYRPLSALAVTALVLGLLSLTAWIEPFLVFLGIIGAVVGAAALWQIAQNTPEMLGRKAAIIGLFLSVFSLVCVSSNWFTHRTLVRNEAKHFARHWFELLQSDQPDKAFDMTRDSTIKPEPLMIDGDMTMPPGGPPEPPDEVYLRCADVRTLLALGDRAQVRYYQTESQGPKSGGDEVTQVYAVTYDKGGQKTTFFVRLEMERLVNEETGTAYWQIANSQAGIKPLALGGQQT
jgi:hypothetical protein